MQWIAANQPMPDADDDLSIIVNTDEYIRHFEAWRDIKNVIPGLTSTKSLFESISRTDLLESYYFQNRSSVMVCGPKAFSAMGSEAIVKSRESALVMAQHLTDASVENNKYVLPDWWNIFLERINESNNSDLKRSIESIEFVFTNRLRFIFAATTNKKINKVVVSLIARSFFQNFFVGILSLYLQGGIDGLRNGALDAKMEDQIFTLLHSHFSFLHGYNPPISLPVATARSARIAKFSFDASNFANQFILLHEIAHTYLHNENSSRSILPQKLYKLVPYDLPNHKALISHVKEAIGDQKIALTHEEMFGWLEKLPEGRNMLPVSWFVLDAFSSERLGREMFEELEADTWALDALLSIYPAGDMADGYFAGPLGFGAAAALFFAMEARKANLSIGELGVPDSFSTSERLRIENVESFLKFACRDSLILPKGVSDLWALSFEYNKWKQACRTGERFMKGASFVINTLAIYLRFETDSQSSTENIIESLEGLPKATRQSESNKGATFQVSSRMKGFGFGEIIDVFVTVAPSVGLGLLANTIYDLAKSCAKKVFIEGEQVEVSTEEIEKILKRALDKKSELSGNDEEQDD